MSLQRPVTDLDARYGDPEAEATSWEEAEELLASAELLWLSTVRPDGRPHVTPLIAVWLEGAIYFATGPGERKAKNLAQNPSCVLTTGCNRLHAGVDLVLEGEAVLVDDEDRLRALATAYVDKYGSDWTFDVRDGAFAHPGGGRAVVFELRPTTAFGFAKAPYGQTRWRFSP